MRIRGIWPLAVAVALLAACSGSERSVEAGVAGSAQASSAIAIGGPGAISTRRARFADLPDRGELLRYDAQAPILDGAYTWHRATLSERHALDAIAGGTLRLAAPDGRLLSFRYDRSIRHDESGDWTWIGHVPGLAGVQAVLTFGAGAAYGSIGQPGAQPLRLTMRNGASWLVETDATQFASLASHAANPVSPDYRIVSPAALQGLRTPRPAAAGAKVAGPVPRDASTATTTTIDLLVGYTPGFASAQGSKANAVTRINNMVDLTNALLSNSQVSGQIRLVRTMQVNYTDTNTNDIALGQLTGYDADTQQRTTPGAAFNALRAAREQYGADLVSLVRPFKDPEQDGCGIGWLVGAGKQVVTATNGWDYFGYSVVSDGSDTNEQDGKTYSCEQHQLAHELGHNMGSQHDQASSKGDDGTLDNPADYGAFDYSFGYRSASGASRFYTVMAYGAQDEIPWGIYSTPDVVSCGRTEVYPGVACGVANVADNARSLRQVMPPVSGFRATVVINPQLLRARSDFDGDGKSDVLWRNASTGANQIWISADSAASQPIASVAKTWKVAGVGDFTGDGMCDILWRNTSTGGNSLWKSGNSGTTQGVTSMPDPAWQVAGIGDFDGDGKADILWRNGTTGANQIWKSASSSTQQATSTVSTAWQVSGVGDFTGDGKADILWRNASTGANSIWKSGNLSTPQPVATLSGAAWQVAGVADFDGDDKSDILWRNKSSGTNAIWLSANSATQHTMNNVGTNWKVAGVGDFNGDFEADILWRASDTGENSIWKSANSHTPQVVSPIPDPAWQVAGLAP